MASAPEFVTRIRSPSNAALCGVCNPLPVNVAMIAPVAARTTVILLKAPWW
jgi:hypothetical protein